MNQEDKKKRLYANLSVIGILIIQFAMLRGSYLLADAFARMFCDIGVPLPYNIEFALSLNSSYGIAIQAIPTIVSLCLALYHFARRRKQDYKHGKTLFLMILLALLQVLVSGWCILTLITFHVTFS